MISDITPSRLFLNAGDLEHLAQLLLHRPQHKLVMTAPHILSVVSQRSGEVFVSEDIDNLAILQVNNVNIEWVYYPAKLVKYFS